MSLVSNATLNQLNFSVRTPIPPFVPNRNAPLSSGVALKDHQGGANSQISAQSLLGHTISVAPVGAVRTYTLPTASSILNEFGRNNDTGVVKTKVGDMIVFNVVNTGGERAYISSNDIGGDGTIVIAHSGAGSSFTGPVARGKITPVYLEWLQVNSGLQGATGLYTVYSV